MRETIIHGLTMEPLTVSDVREIVECKTKQAKRIFYGERKISSGLFHIFIAVKNKHITLSEAKQKWNFLKSLLKRRDSEPRFPNEYVREKMRESDEYYAKLYGTRIKVSYWGHEFFIVPEGKTVYEVIADGILPEFVDEILSVSKPESVKANGSDTLPFYQAIRAILQAKKLRMEQETIQHCGGDGLIGH